MLPHQDNQSIPLLLQASGAVTLMMITFIIFGMSVFHGNIIERYAGENYAAVIAAVLIDQTNEERLDNNLSELDLNPLLTASAQLKADDMADGAYFAHTSPTGLSPWYWFQQAGYKFNYAGENLAVNFRDSSSVTKAWMNSPTHRANIVGQNYEEVGIATATGKYKGKTTTYVAQHFGTPYPPATFSLRNLSDDTEEKKINDPTINQANQLIAAVSEVSTFDKLLVQPDKIYLMLFGGLLTLAFLVAGHAIYKIKDQSKRKQIITNMVLISIVIISLGLATMELLSGQVIT